MGHVYAYHLLNHRLRKIFQRLIQVVPTLPLGMLGGTSAKGPFLRAVTM